MTKNEVIVDFDDPSVFNDAYIPYLEDMHETQIYYGGSSSGKSVFLAQRCVMDVLKGKRNYLVCRAVGRTIKGSVFNEITKVINGFGLQSLFSTNLTDKIITCKNGYQILFAGLDDVEKLKSITPAKGVITDVWVEEATEIQQTDIRQLDKRLRGGSQGVPKRIILSFNPILQTSWIYTEYFKHWDDSKTAYRDDYLSILKTTYKDNRYLTDGDIRRLENETDEYFYNVYTLGNWGILGDVIFTNWATEDLSDRKFDSFKNGLDFGFSSDPAAIIKTSRKGDTIYILDEFYERGLTNDILADEVKGIIGQEYIYCDSAEPKSIAELQQHGVNALSASKGKDSVVHGIQWLQQNTIVVDTLCVHTKQELQQYQWKKDKDGNSIRQPVDKNNHLIDALRYAYCDEWRGGASVIPDPFAGW